MSPTPQPAPFVDREEIQMRLLALIASLKDPASNEVVFRVATRRAVLPSELLPEHQPAAFLVATSEHVTTKRGLPAERTFSFDLVIYVINDIGKEPIGEETRLPITQINKILAGVERVLAPSVAASPPVQTLGYGTKGPVSHVWIEGEIEHDEGLLYPQAMAVVPIKVLAVG